MRSKVTCIAALVLFVGVAAALPLGAQTTHDVQIVGISFSPSFLIIQQGDIVRWTNASALTHTTTSGTGCVADGIWNSGFMVPGAQFSFTFNSAGDFPYYCIPHCLSGMVGSVRVNPAPADCRINCPQLDGGVINTNGPSDKSPDINGDTVVDLIDISLFAQAFPPNPYDYCVDYDCDGVIGLVDLSIFAQHVFHQGPQPGNCI